MSDFNPETRPGERWWEMISLKPHCTGSAPYKTPIWYHDYTTQIQMDRYRYYTRLIGHPLIIYQGQRYTDDQFAPMLGLKVNQLQAHMAHGAIRYRDKFRWDYDYTEYDDRIKAYEAEQERKAEQEEAEKERRRAEVRANLAAMRKEVAEKIHIAHQKRREAFYAQFTITAREDKPGKLRILYVNGARSSKAEACKILGFGEVVLLKQLKKGDFKFQGHTVEVRYSDPQAFKDQRNKARREERARAREDRERARKIERERIREEKAAAAKERRRLYDQKRQAAKRATMEKKKSGPKPKQSPFRWEPYPVPPNGKRAVLYFRGEKLPEAMTKELTGFGRDKCFDLARKGRCFFPDGSVLEYIEDGSRGFKGITEDGPKIQPAGKIKGKQRYQVRIMRDGKRIVLSTSVDLKVLEKYLADILVNEKWKSILDKKQGLG